MRGYDFIKDDKRFYLFHLCTVAHKVARKLELKEEWGRFQFSADINQFNKFSVNVAAELLGITSRFQEV